MKQADIVVIGGGPAGLCAAISAAQSGAGVLIIDKNKNLGGQLIKQTHMFLARKNNMHLPGNRHTGDFDEGT